MQVSELVAAVVGRGLLDAPKVTGDPLVDVRTVTHDSRAVEPGALYCCVPGAAHDGHDFAGAAVAAGATALLCERPVDAGVTQIQVPSVRSAMGPLASAIAGFPSDRLQVVGVTGTNGKTTTTQMLAGILDRAGRPCGLIGTLTGARTTPEAPDLQLRLAEMERDGKVAVAMEVSSHALDLHRVDGTRFRVAVFTNLSRDHLDHHHSMDEYFEAKARLFTPDRCDHAVICTDDLYGRRLAAEVEVPVTAYGLADAGSLRVGPHGSAFVWQGVEMATALAGRFNVANALAAASAALLLGIDPTDIAAGLAQTASVAGRFERVEEGQDFLAAVDYAHTPDGLRQLLASARELTNGQVIVVFGAGGDRDRDKRPEMGAAVSELADIAVLTTDNPRSEDPAAIISAVQNGMTSSADLRIEPDRAAAIALAVSMARPGDVLLVAGKGHETTQITGDVVTPFDDRLVLRDALRTASPTGEGAR